jgi:outer membrane protein
MAGEGPSVVITQPLLRDAGWRTSTSGLRDANLSADAEEVALESRTQQVLFDVKSAYFEILRRSKLIDVNKQAVQRDEDLLSFSKAKVEAKLATQRDVLSAEIILAQDRGRLVNAEAQHQAALDQLSDILGLRIARPLQVQDVDVALQPVAVQEQVWIAQALRNNPGVKRARLDLERSVLAKQVAGNGRLPQLDLQLAYDEVRSAVSEGPVTPGLIQPRERTWQGSVTLSYPLFNKPLGNAYEKASLEYEQSRRALLDTERQAVLDVRDTVRNLQRIEDRISILKKNIEGARAKVEFAKVNFQLGRASNLDITDAQKDLLNAETDSVDELVNYRVEHARLEQLLGGSIE